MLKRLPGVLLCGFVLLRQGHAQEVVIVREAKPKYPKAQAVSHEPAKTEIAVAKAIAVEQTKPVVDKVPLVARPPGPTAKKPEAVALTTPKKAAVPAASPSNVPAQVHKQETVAAQPAKKTDVGDKGRVATTIAPAIPPKQSATTSNVSVSTAPAAKQTVTTSNNATAPAAKKSEGRDTPRIASATSSTTPKQSLALSEASPKTEVPAPKPKAVSIKPDVVGPPPTKKPEKPQLASSSAATVHKPEPLVSRTLAMQSRTVDALPTQSISNHLDTAFTKLSDGFDFPVGKPDAQGYYKARGFRSRGHLGEDWDGVRGGDSDLGDPIYSIGDGVVVFAHDVHMGWGNVLIVRHSYREGGIIKNIDALYGHLDSMLVRRGEAVARGQKIATMGNAHGLYDAHLHLEIRKNIEIGMSRAAFAQDFSNYYDPSQFILMHRHLQAGGTYRVAMNTFARDARINFDRARNYSHSHYRGGSSESAAALKKAVTSQH